MAKIRINKITQTRDVCLRCVSNQSMYLKDLQKDLQKLVWK